MSITNHRLPGEGYSRTAIAAMVVLGCLAAAAMIMLVVGP